MSEHVRTVELDITTREISSICSRIVTQMQLEGVTYCDIAEYIGMDENKLVLAFSDQTKMTLRMLADICHYLNLDIDLKIGPRRSPVYPIEYCLGA